MAISDSSWKWVSLSKVHRGNIMRGEYIENNDRWVLQPAAWSSNTKYKLLATPFPFSMGYGGSGYLQYR